MVNGEDSRVSLRRISPGVLVKQATGDDAVREARFLSRLSDSPFVTSLVPNSTYVAPSGTWSSYAMRVVDGTSLHTYAAHLQALPRRDPPPSLVRSLLAVLRTMLTAGVVHRDVIARNWLVTREAEVTLIDFSWALDRRGAIGDTRTAPSTLGVPHSQPQWEHEHDCDVVDAGTVFANLFPDTMWTDLFVDMRDHREPCELATLDHFDRLLDMTLRQHSTAHPPLRIPAGLVDSLHQAYRVNASKVRLDALAPRIIRPGSLALAEYGSWNGYFSVLLALQMREARVVSVELESMRVSRHVQVLSEQGIRPRNTVCHGALVASSAATAAAILAQHREHQQLDSAPLIPIISTLASLPCTLDVQLALSTTHWWGFTTQHDALSGHAALVASACVTFLEIPSPADSSIWSYTNVEQQASLLEWYRAPWSTVASFVAEVSTRAGPGVRTEWVVRTGDRDVWQFVNEPLCLQQRPSCTREQLVHAFGGNEQCS